MGYQRVRAGSFDGRVLPDANLPAGHIRSPHSDHRFDGIAATLGDYDFTSDRRGVAVNRALSVADLLGSFQILGVLNGGAVVMFALEMVGLKCRLILRLVDWLQG